MHFLKIACKTLISSYKIVMYNNDALVISTSSSVFEVRLFLLLAMFVFSLIFKSWPVVFILLTITFCTNAVRDGVLSLEYTCASSQVIIWIVIVEMLLFMGIFCTAGAIMLTFSHTNHIFKKEKFALVSRIFIVEVEYGMGNFEILSANIGILTASSFVMINSHLKGHNASIFAVIILGFLFFLNQIDETFSHVSIDMATESSAVLACLYLHLSHLILCEIVFVVSLLYSAILRNGTDMVMELASVYWHLVEVVWIVILSAFCSI